MWTIAGRSRRRTRRMRGELPQALSRRLVQRDELHVVALRCDGGTSVTSVSAITAWRKRSAGSRLIEVDDAVLQAAGVEAVQDVRDQRPADRTVTWRASPEVARPAAGRPR